MTTATTLPDHKALLLREVTDIPRLLRGLRLPVRRRGTGYVISCPWHDERTPSCNVRLGPAGSVQVHCHGCDFTGNVLHLVAAVLRLDLRRDFPLVLEETARLGGLALDMGPTRTLGAGRSPAAPGRCGPVPAPAPPTLPPAAEVAALWAACLPVDTDPGAVAGLESRAIDPGMVALYDLARVLPEQVRRPRWARHWTPAHRLLVPAYNAHGELVSLRARRLDGTSAPPKVLVPGGHTDHGTLLACPVARFLLTTGRCHEGSTRIVITEGEPDFLTTVARVSDACEEPPAILGIYAGSWSADLASRIPDGVTIDLRTDDDDAGHRYAAAIYATLAARYAAERLTILVQPSAATYLETSL